MKRILRGCSWLGVVTAVASFVVQPVPRRAPRSIPPLQLSNDDEGIGIGIDLGTTHSAVAYLSPDGIPSIIPIPENGRTLPSVVALSDDGTPIIGAPALQSTHNVFCNVKRVIGTGGKLSKEVSAVVPGLVVNTEGKTYKKNTLENRIYDATHHPSLLRAGSSTIPPEVVSSYILQHLKQVAEEATGKSVTRAVVGIPAYFDDAQRDATQKAAVLAGIPKVKLLREPEAAALAYGVGKEQVVDDDSDELVLVFDLGGGTFDVSMLVVGGGVTEIISTSGNANLGGSDMDRRVVQHCQKVLRAAQVSTKQWNREAQNSLLRSAEKMRIYLSNNKRMVAALPKNPSEWEFLEDPSAVIVQESSFDSNETHVAMALTRSELEALCKEDLQALIRPVREVAIMAGALLPGDASPTMVDAALQMEEDMSNLDFDDFYKEEETAKEDIDPDILLQLQEFDVKSAKKAQQKGRKRARDVAKEERKFRKAKRQLSEQDVKVRDGIHGRPITRVVLVGGATRMPAIGRLLAALTGTVPQKTVNPDEAVALGCAVHVGVLDGQEGMGKVLNPMQAAILRAFAEQGMMDDIDDEEEFGDAEYF